MDSDRTHAVRLRPGQPFLPLFFSLAGTALLNAWLQLMSANFRAHIVALALGTIFLAWSLFPLRGRQVGDARTRRHAAGQSGLAAALNASFFFLFGAVLGGLVIYGSLLLLGWGIFALHFLPWRRLGCDQHTLVLPCCLAAAGCGSVLFAGWQQLDMMFLPLAAWAFWTATLVGPLWRKERPRGTAPAVAACDT